MQMRKAYSLRLCLLSPVPPPYGGISKWTELINQTVKEIQGVEITQIDTAPHWREIDDLSLIKRIFGGGGQAVRDYINFLSIIVTKPDVIHLTTSGSLSVLQNLLISTTARIFRIPFVYHIHFGRVPEIAKNKSLEWRLMACVIRNSSMVIAITPDTSGVIKQLIPNVKIKYIPNPIDGAHLSQISIKEKGNNTVLYLGWILSKKGIEELVRAWAELDLEKWKLIIAGPGKEEYKQDLIRKYRPENVEFIGELEHPLAMKVMADCDIFVLPSYTEGFPNVILEAMALEKPIIATSVGAIPEMLSGDCGIVIKPKNVNELKISLVRLIQDEELCKRLGRNAAEKIKNHYSLDLIFTQYFEIWLSVSRNITHKM